MALIPLLRLSLAQGLRAPATWLTVAVGAAMLALAVLFGQFHFVSADRVRLLLTAGVAAAALCGVFLGVTLAGSGVQAELSSRTAAALFAKPVGRGAFLASKALGAWLATGAALLPLLLLHLGAVAVVNTWGFDLKERQFQTGADGFQPLWTDVPWGTLIAAHALAWVQAGVLSALAAGLASRLNQIATILVAFAVFVASHVLAGLGQHGALLLPALGLANLDEALQFPAAAALGPAYFGLCVLHSLLYAAASLFLALGFFSHQDIP